MKMKTKRNLFAELIEGFDALAAAREGKRTRLLGRWKTGSKGAPSPTRKPNF